MRNDEYNRYEDVKEDEVVEEAHYADPYYASETDFLRKPQVNENESTEGYLMLSNASSSYAQKENQLRLMPRITINGESYDFNFD